MRKYIVDTVGPLPVVLLVMDADNNNAVLNSFIYDDDSRILAQYDGDWQAGADKYFYLSDRLGSVRLIIDDTGTAVSRYTYDPFGNTLDDECEIDADLYNPFMFTGQWFDEEIDQYYLRARYYDPYIGRFSTRDPVCGDLKMPMTLHVYLYALNNPINRIDPTGRFSMIGIKKTAQHVSDAFESRGEVMTAAVRSYHGDLTDLFDLADQLTIIQNAHAMMFYDPREMRFAAEHIQLIADLMIMDFADKIGIAIGSTDFITEACDYIGLWTCMDNYVFTWSNVIKYASGKFVCYACAGGVVIANPIIAAAACTACGISTLEDVFGSHGAYQTVKTCFVDNCGSE